MKGGGQFTCAWGKGELSSFLPVGRGKTPLMDWRGLDCVHDGAWRTPGIKELKEGGEWCL